MAALAFSLFRRRVRPRAALAAGQPLTLAIAQQGRTLQLPVEVVGVQREILELASTAGSLPIHLLQPGALVELRQRHRAVEPAQVIWFDPGPTTHLVVRSLRATVTVDQRREERHVPVAPLETTAVDLSGGRIVSVRVAVIDLSGGGVGVVASRALEPGSTLGLSLPFPGGDAPVQTRARVVWSAQLGRFWRSGLEFTRFAHDQEAVLLRKLLAEQQHWRRLQAPD